MKRVMTLSRRNFLRTSALVTAGAALSLSKKSGYSAYDSNNQEAGRFVQSAAIPDLEVNLRAMIAEQAIFSGHPTPVWKYEGKVLRGDANSLQVLANSYLGPTFRVKSGQRIRVDFVNEVPQETIIHWHGLHLSQEMDAHPQYVVQPGETYRYEFQVTNRAGTYWYHAHPHRFTGPQIYRGLAGLFLVSDEVELAAGLPKGEFDLPLVLQDRTVNPKNQLVYRSGGMMGQMTGFLGDQILVNGYQSPVLSAAAQSYRLRILNASNARIYKLAWEDGTPVNVIGTDGGLLEKAIVRPYVMLGPGERVEVWVDFSQKMIGNQTRLVSLPFSLGAAAMHGMSGSMGMMGSRSSLANGSSFTVLTVQIDRKGSGIKAALPDQLSTVVRYREEDAVNHSSPRIFTLGGMGMGMMSGMGWTINGRTFDMEGVASDEVVKINTLEAWIYNNQIGPGMMGGMMGAMNQMPHPMHIHGIQFQVIERQVDSTFHSDYETVQEGFVDDGWKDTVLVMPGERVKLLVRFEDFTGLFLHHCHNLEHEDLGMMRNYQVVK